VTGSSHQILLNQFVLSQTGLNPYSYCQRSIALHKLLLDHRGASLGREILYALEGLWHNAAQPSSTGDFSLEAVAVLFICTFLKFYPCEFAMKSIDQHQMMG